MKNQGVVLVFVLLALFIAAIIIATTVFLRYQSAQASRERALLALNQAGVVGARNRLDTGLLTTIEAGRQWANAAIRSTGFAFGGSDQSSVSAALAPLRTVLQQASDAALCDVRDGLQIRVYFTPRACGETLPPGLQLGNPVRLSGAPDLLETYEVPFIAVLRSRTGENQRSQIIEGVLRIRAGGGPISQYQLFLASGFGLLGEPAYFSGGEIYEGPVHVSGIPNFGIYYNDAPGPFFLSGFSSGRCVGVSSMSCPGGQGAIQFLQVGAIEPQALAPNAFAPCYGASCPRFPGGVDWNAPSVAVPTSNPRAAVEFTKTGTYTALLEIDAYRGLSLGLAQDTSIQEAQIIVPGGGTLPFYISPDGRIALQRGAGENLLENAEWVSSAWWAGARVENGEVILEDRDGYYASSFALPPGPISWNVAFEGNTQQTSYALQVGLRYCTGSEASTCNNWIGSAWGGSTLLPPGQDWTPVSASFTTPANATRAWVWIQLDGPFGAVGRARLRNLRLTPGIPAGTVLDIPMVPDGITADPIIRVQDSLEVGGRGSPIAANLEANTPLTLRAANNILILGSLLSSSPACVNPARIVEAQPVPSDCPGSPAQGMLGLYAENGNVEISETIPDAIYLTASIAAPNGYFGPSGYPTSTKRVHLLGSVAAANYRSFDSGNQRSWVIELSFDPRAGTAGLAPPGWPLLPRQVWGIQTVYTRETTP